MKQALRLLRQSKMISLAILGIAVGLILQGLEQKTALHWWLGTIAIVELLPVAWDMVQDVRAGRYGIDILAIAAVVAAVILGQYWAAIVVVLMIILGESVEKYATRRSRREANALLAAAPQRAVLIRKGKPAEVAAGELKPRDTIRIDIGEVVPADAVIIDGQASFDESSLTGESLPQIKQPGDQLLSGAINLDGPVTAKVTADAAHSQYQQLIKLVQGAAKNPAPFVRLNERYSLPFTFIAFALASAVWALSGHAIRFLEVIIVATPAPLLLAAPIALLSGMARASRSGIIVKTGAALERLQAARTIAFNKTGTLTRGQLVVQEVKTFHKFDRDEVLSLAASLEQTSAHAVARAVVLAAAERKLRLAKGKHVQEVAGRGVQAALKGRQVLVGNLAFIQEAGVDLPTSLQPTAAGTTCVYVAVDGTLAGRIALRDEIRPEATSTLQQLRRQGLKRMLLVTGDSASAAQGLAQELEIETVHAEALPAAKLHLLEKVVERPVVFVGDGVTDAPALTASSVGIALGARSSTAAAEAADIVILSGDLSRLATAHRLARRSFVIAQQSILAGIALSLMLMVLFATGKFPPLLGAVAQEVVDIIVILYALQARRIAVD